MLSDFLPARHSTFCPSRTRSADSGAPLGLALNGGVNLRLYFGSPRYSLVIGFDADLRLRNALRVTMSDGLMAHERRTSL